jgi:cytoskeletal protein RodZ
VTGKRRGEAPRASRPWHERTPLVLGASIAALLVIALLYFAVSFVDRNYNPPPRAPSQYIEPTDTTATATATASTAITTTPTITSTVPPQTSEIDNPTSQTSSSDTSTTSTTTTSVSITQSRRSHYGPDARWPYPMRPAPNTVVPPQH